MFFLNGVAPSPAGSIIRGYITYAGDITVKVGSHTATPTYTGLVAAGQYQMNFVVPPDLAPGDYPITVTVAGQTSPAIITLPVK
jgi:uncharacterized protein (TIGR03437 family)